MKHNYNFRSLLFCKML